MMRGRPVGSFARAFVRPFVLAVLVLVALIVYLFASAPVPLPQGRGEGREQVAVELLFRLVAAENAAIRTLYTQQIVGPGQQRGLAFREEWKHKDEEAGPLPALFLREMSVLIQRDTPELMLFLGSDFPIAPANRFQGMQAREFEQLKRDRQPRFFRDTDTGRFTAMFVDLASAPPCVTCHNEHAQSPKRDWQRDDVMGATTWMYPRGEVSMSEALALLASLRRAARETYGSYLKKVRGFSRGPVPQIGTQWPADGLFLPDEDTFMQAAEARTSAHSVRLLLEMSRQAALRPREAPAGS